MLSKFILRAAVTAAALIWTTGSASAEQYRILMMEHAFFPDVSFVQPGDEVVFVNMSGETRDLAASDGSWVIAAMANGAEATLALTEGMPSDFTGLAPSGDAANVVTGVMNFSEPPEITQGN
jgi:plastocyanin